MAGASPFARTRTGSRRHALRGSHGSYVRLDQVSQRVRGVALHLIHGEEAYRARLRAAELVASLASGDARPSDLRAQRSADLGAQLGLSRHEARTADASVIELSGRSQGLFDAVDELRIVVVEHAEALRDTSVIARFPAEAALVLVSEAKIATRARRAAKPKSAPEAAPTDLPTVVEAAGGTIELIARLLPQELPGWIAARATLLGVELAPQAITELAPAAAPDTQRVDQEIPNPPPFPPRPPPPPAHPPPS